MSDDDDNFISDLIGGLLDALLEVLPPCMYVLIVIVLLFVSLYYYSQNQ